MYIMNKFIVEKPYKINKNLENFTSVNYEKGFNIIEPLISAGNKTKENNSKNIKKKGEFKTNIDRNTVIRASQKIVNNVFNDVAQSNTAEVFNAIAASNSISLNAIECDTLNITNIDQNADALADTIAVFVQKTKSSISTKVQTSIQKEISNDVPNDAADLMKIQNSAMKDFLDATPGLEKNKNKKIGFFGALAAAVASVGGKREGFDVIEPLISAGNKKSIDNSYKLDNELKKEFNLNENFSVEDKDEIYNTINNKVKQENFAKCQQSASSINNLTLNDIVCKNLNIDKIKQNAFARSLLTCTFNQVLVSEVATEISNRIDKRISRMSNAAKTDADKDRIKKFGDAVKERLVNASGLEGAVYDPSKESSKNDSSKQTGSDNVAAKAIAKKEKEEKEQAKRQEIASKKTSDYEGSNKSNDPKEASSNDPKETSSNDPKETNSNEQKKESKEKKDEMVTFIGIRMTKLQRNILIGIIILLLVLVIVLITTLVSKAFAKKSTPVKTEILDESSDSSNI